MSPTDNEGERENDPPAPILSDVSDAATAHDHQNTDDRIIIRSTVSYPGEIPDLYHAPLDDKLVRARGEYTQFALTNHRYWWIDGHNLLGALNYYVRDNHQRMGEAITDVVHEIAKRSNRWGHVMRVVVVFDNRNARRPPIVSQVSSNVYMAYADHWQKADDYLLQAASLISSKKGLVMSDDRDLLYLLNQKGVDIARMGDFVRSKYWTYQDIPPSEKTYLRMTPEERRIRRDQELAKRYGIYAEPWYPPDRR